MRKDKGVETKEEAGDSISQLLVLILAFFNLTFLVLFQRQTGLPSNHSSRS